MGKSIYQQLKDSEIVGPEDIIPIIKQLKAQGLSGTETIELLHRCNKRFKISDEQFKVVINVLVEKIFAAPNNYQYPISITNKELEFLKDIGDAEERKVLFGLLVLHKRDNHPTGWVRYNPQDLMTVLGYREIDKKRVDKMISKATQEYISLRVIGSKQALICFKVNYRNDDGVDEFFVCDDSEVESLFNEYVRGDHHDDN